MNFPVSLPKLFCILPQLGSYSGPLSKLGNVLGAENFFPAITETATRWQDGNTSISKLGRRTKV